FGRSGNWAGVGIDCWGGSPTIRKNTISDARFIGIDLYECAALVIDNVISNSDLTGIRCIYPSSTMIVNNTVVDNAHGIQFDGEGINPVFERNIVAFNDQVGIECGLGASPPIVTCCDIFGNGGGDAICGIDGGGNMFEDPLFCGPPGSDIYTLHLDSPCLPGNNSCGQLIGALPPACGGGAYVECPGDMIVPAHSTVPYLVLEGFTITNIHDTSLSFAYSVQSEGPATLVDNGDPASLTGVTPLIDPGESFTPPEAALDIPAIRENLQQTVTYTVWDPVIPTIIARTTTITFEPPVPVFINSFSATAREAAVELTWEILSYESVKGFNIYRNLGGTETRVQVNSGGLVPPEARKYTDTNVHAGRSYQYTLGVVLADDSEVGSPTASVRIKALSLALSQNYPNPFNPSTTISFTLPKRT
ncbi:MAG: right-handed parallel beta-helix repeat-containing protein, partial [Candidatus Latescibacterota bacterium]